MSAATLAERDLTLLDLLDRILDKGAVISGDLTISVADVDLIFLGLKVILASVERMNRARSEAVASPRPLWRELLAGRPTSTQSSAPTVGETPFSRS